MKCDLCAKEFPSELIQTMFTSMGIIKIDAMCALKLRNGIHGLNDKKFQGEQANELLEKTKKYLERNIK